MSEDEDVGECQGCNELADEVMQLRAMLAAQDTEIAKLKSEVLSLEFNAGRE